jgi:hypothetical protein
LVRPAQLLASLFSLEPAQPLHSSRGSVPRSSGDHAVGRQNWCDRRHCLRRCLRLNQLNHCNRPEGLSLKASTTVWRGVRIGATGATACAVVFACTNSTTAIVPRDCPSSIRRPHGWAEELVRPASLLESLFSLEPAQPLHSSRGTVPQGFGDRTAGRKNWCDRRNCLRRCLRLNRLDHCNRPEGLSLKASTTMLRGIFRMITPSATCVTAARLESTNSKTASLLLENFAQF